MQRALALLALLLSSCAVITSSKRWTPVEFVRPAGLEVVDTDHSGRFAGMSVILSGAGKVASLPHSTEDLHICFKDRSTSLWALGLLLPVLPTFGVGPSEEGARVALSLRMSYDGELPWPDEPSSAFHAIDPRSVHIVPGGTAPPVRVVAWDVHGHPEDPERPLPTPGSFLRVSAREPLVLFFDVTHAELEAAGECLLEFVVEGPDGAPVPVRLRFRPGTVWHFTLLG